MGNCKISVDLQPLSLWLLSGRCHRRVHPWQVPLFPYAAVTEYQVRYLIMKGMSQLMVLRTSKFETE